MNKKQFLQVKKGDQITILFDSGIASNNEKKLISSGAPRYSKKYNLHKLTLKNSENLNGCKYYAYLRGEKITFAHGNMAISVKNINL